MDFMTLVGIVLMTGLFCAIYCITVYNNLLTCRNNIKKSWSNIEILLVQRNKELPKLVATCQRYMQHEQSLLKQLTETRSRHSNATSSIDVAALNQAEHNIQQQTHQLFAVAEQYPDLHSNEHYLKIQQRISELEVHIADRRDFYNETVTLYNARIFRIPDCVIAWVCHYSEAKLFDW